MLVLHKGEIYSRTKNVEFLVFLLVFICTIHVLISSLLQNESKRTRTFLPVLMDLKNLLTDSIIIKKNFITATATEIMGNSVKTPVTQSLKGKIGEIVNS